MIEIRASPSLNCTYLIGTQEGLSNALESKALKELKPQSSLDWSQDKHFSTTRPVLWLMTLLICIFYLFIHLEGTTIWYFICFLFG